MIAGFLTGSRVYGKPRDDSDLDLCLLVTKDELDLLRKCADMATGDQEHAEEENEENEVRMYPPNGRVLRFGKLNVLCFIHNDTEGDFFSFALGTVKMRKDGSRKEENRDTAVATIQALMNMTLPTTTPTVSEVSL